VRNILALWLAVVVTSLLSSVHAAPFSASAGARSDASEYATTSERASDVIQGRVLTSAATPPRNLTGRVYSSSTAELFWDRVSHSVAVDVYEIFRDGQLLATTSGDSHVDRDLMPGTTYRYQVRALYADGTRSQATTVFSLRSLASGAFAEPELALDRTPSSDSRNPDISPPAGLRGKVYGQKSLEVFWDRQKDRNYHYLVRFNGEIVDRTSGTSWYTNEAITGAVNQVAVATIDEQGSQSAFVGIELLTTGAALPAVQLPDAPQALRGAVYSNSTIELFWQRANPTDAKFRVFVDGIVFGDTSGTSIIIRNLREGTTFRFSVVTLDEDGLQSNEVSTELTTRGRVNPNEPAPTNPEPEPEPVPGNPEPTDPEPTEPARGPAKPGRAAPADRLPAAPRGPCRCGSDRSASSGRGCGQSTGCWRR